MIHYKVACTFLWRSRVVCGAGSDNVTINKLTHMIVIIIIADVGTMVSPPVADRVITTALTNAQFTQLIITARLKMAWITVHFNIA